MSPEDSLPVFVRGHLAPRVTASKSDSAGGDAPTPADGPPVTDVLAGAVLQLGPRTLPSQS